MHIVVDVFGRKVRLTEERLEHLVKSHPEMEESFEKIIETLQNPERVIESKSDISVELFYHFYVQTMVGDKWLCVVVKNLNMDFFVITAYFTDKIKKGNVLWTKP